MPFLLYGGFFTLIALMLALDLGVFHRKAKEESLKSAVGWTLVWIAVACAFSVFVFFAYNQHWLGLGAQVPQLGGGTKEVFGATAWQQFVAGYMLEKSLSMDNVFIISVLFTSFGVPLAYQHRTLFWGIIGAVMMRATMILVGAELVHRFDWLLVLFGAFLIFTALKMGFSNEEEGDKKLEEGFFVRMARKFLPISKDFHGTRFFIQENSKWLATPLFLTLIVVEVTDVVFALDSIPAVFGVTHDPFIVLTSNIFAILGLRALYFCLAAMVKLFRYLKPALVLILLFIGVKLILQTGPEHSARLLEHFGMGTFAWKNTHLADWISLVVVGALLGGAILLSLVRKR